MEKYLIDCCEKTIMLLTKLRDCGEISQTEYLHHISAKLAFLEKIKSQTPGNN